MTTRSSDSIKEDRPTLLPAHTFVAGTSDAAPPIAPPWIKAQRGGVAGVVLRLQILADGVRLPDLRLGRALRLIESLAVRALRRAIARALTMLLRLAVAASVAFALGLGSAWYLIDVGSPLTVESFGPWRLWPQAGRVDADPYTRAHFARLGWIVPANSQVAIYRATHDSAGRLLIADCEYDVVGPAIAAPWWSLAVFDARGGILDVPAERHVISRASLVTDGTDRMIVRLARETRPGNWLPTLGGSTMTLVLSVQSTAESATALTGGVPNLPAIERVECR